MNRQVRRVEKAIDELIKIADDGKGGSSVLHLLDSLRTLKCELENDD